MTTAVCAAIADCNTELEIIPGGYTSKLQVMDVSLNKPFKDRVRDQVEDFILNEPIGSKPTRQIVSHWISRSWNCIPPLFVQNGWRKAGYLTQGLDVAEIDSASDDDTEPEPEEDILALEVEVGDDEEEEEEEEEETAK